MPAHGIATLHLLMEQNAVFSIRGVKLDSRDIKTKVIIEKTDQDWSLFKWCVPLLFDGDGTLVTESSW